LGRKWGRKSEKGLERERERKGKERKGRKRPKRDGVETGEGEFFCIIGF